MQFPDVLCYIFLTITVAASCAEADDKQTNNLTALEPGRRIKRASVMIENYQDRLNPKPNVVYKLLLQSQKRLSPNSRYGSPLPHYKTKRSPKPNNKPSNKFKRYKNPNFMSSKQLSPKQKHKRNSKPRFISGTKPKRVSRLAVPKIAGFGEPPTDHANDYQPLEQSYGEPPIDLYGAPLNTKVDKYNKKQHTYPVWAKDYEASFSFSNMQPSFATPELDDEFYKWIPQDYYDQILIKHKKNNKYSKKKTAKYYNNNKPEYFGEIYTAPIKKPKRNHKGYNSEDNIVVGGRYAEPPPRVISSFQPSGPVSDSDDELTPLYGYVNSKVSSQASPYMNYKNSNLAFSPQNLNDAFSVVDK